MSNSKDMGATISPPTLPKSGGTIHGMGETLETPGSDGTVQISIPLPITSGRGIDPIIGLGYSSYSGNGPFGIGWQCSMPSISRRTGKSILRYNNEDQFIGPDGSILIPECDTLGNKITRLDSYIQGIELSGTCIVSRYFPRVEGVFDLVEYWEPAESEDFSPFWLIHSSDGGLHCYGKNGQARIFDLEDNKRIAKWFLEESVSPYGDHIYYNYASENINNITDGMAHQFTANRYLEKVLYGNYSAKESLFILDNAVPSDDQWHFILIFDYGQRGTDPLVKPSFNTDSQWPSRQDCFSDFSYGFELRTCRLCRQVLMFHNFSELGNEPYLVTRLLLEYDENPVASMLTGLQQFAYENDGAVLRMPPQDISYTLPKLSTDNQWSKLEVSPEVNNGINYQVVDLYGEGIPGILCRNDDCWYYCEPERDPEAPTSDAVRYTNWTPLSQIPSMRKGMLIDFDGDGYMEWLVLNPALSGFFNQNTNRTWSGFIPLKSLPTEMFHPQSLLEDITNSGTADLIMIGPRSVKLYPNKEKKYDQVLNVLQKAGVVLPLQSSNERELLAFSDILGSGQQHLIRICYNSVTCWPNLGNGSFGDPLTLPGFEIDEKQFNPSRVLLADIDGSGATDIIYVMHEKLLLFQNYSGNKFADPIAVSLPDGVLLDDLSFLSVADMRGRGMSDLVLSLPYIKPQHWTLSLLDEKPYLLKAINNNIGLEKKLSYRSSSQFWLDEKYENNQAECLLPFAVPVVREIISLDEISGAMSTQVFTYRYGVYDRLENDFAGFGRIDTVQTATGAGGNTTNQIQPQHIRTWYHTGRKEDEDRAIGEACQFDPDAFTLRGTKLTYYLQADDTDTIIEADENEQRWLYKAITGMPLRAETYGIINGEEVFFGTQSYRYQVRLLQKDFLKLGCVTLPLTLEQLSYNYEGVYCDPQYHQEINLQYDQYGTPLQMVSIQYPRREKPLSNPYPDSLPSTTWASSYDEQQSLLRITRQRQAVYHITAEGQWRLGIPHQSRTDLFTYSQDYVPDTGLYLELLTMDGSLFLSPLEATFCGQSEIVYFDGKEPDVRALIFYTINAAFDDSDLEKYKEVLSEEELVKKLQAAGYKRASCILGDVSESDIWTEEIGFTEYADASEFYKVISQKQSQLIDELNIYWDSYSQVIVSTEDSLGNSTVAIYDYRFLQPYEVTDINNNKSKVKIDALGNITCKTYWGKENDIEVGFKDFDGFVSPSTVEEALEIQTLDVKECILYETHSWMGRITNEQLEQLSTNGNLWNDLVSLNAITYDGYVRSKGRSGEALYEIEVDGLKILFQSAKRLPVHALSLTADRYPEDPSQQIAANIAFSSGIGISQNSIRVEPGLSYQYEDQNGLVIDDSGVLAEIDAKDRWIISDRSEHSGNGLLLHGYQPFYLDSWKFIEIVSLAATMLSNTIYYDSLGRVVQTVNPKGYITRNSYYPWFVSSEDENDTLE